MSNSEAHSQEVLPNNDDSEVESICSLPINNQQGDCPLIDDYCASSDDEGVFTKPGPDRIGSD